MMENFLKKGLVVFVLAWALNSIENFALVWFNKVPVGKISIISSVIFALVFVFLYNLIKGKNE